MGLTSDKQLNNVIDLGVAVDLIGKLSIEMAHLTRRASVDAETLDETLAELAAAKAMTGFQAHSAGVKQEIIDGIVAAAPPPAEGEDDETIADLRKQLATAHENSSRMAEERDEAQADCNELNRIIDAERADTAIVDYMENQKNSLMFRWCLQVTNGTDMSKLTFREAATAALGGDYTESVHPDTARLDFMLEETMCDLDGKRVGYRAEVDALIKEAHPIEAATAAMPSGEGKEGFLIDIIKVNKKTGEIEAVAPPAPTPDAAEQPGEEGKFVDAGSITFEPGKPPVVRAPDADAAEQPGKSVAARIEAVMKVGLCPMVEGGEFSFTGDYPQANERNAGRQNWHPDLLTALKSIEALRISSREAEAETGGER